MRSLIIFLSLLFMCSPVFAKDKLTTFDKETLDEVYTQYFHLENQCSKDLVRDIAMYFYLSTVDQEWKSCGVVLNDTQKQIWSCYWALFSWKAIQRETKTDICNPEFSKVITNEWEMVFLSLLFDYTSTKTDFDVCSFNPTIGK